MKKQFLNYLQAIRFKILNDDLTKVEMIVLFMMLMIGGILILYHFNPNIFSKY